MRVTRLAVVVGMGMGMSLAACGGGSKSAPEAPVTPVAAAPEPPPPPPPPPPDPTIAEQVVADRFMECQRPLNMKDLAAIAACSSDSAEATLSGTTDVTKGGTAIAEQFYKAYFDAFPDLQVRTPLLLVNGDHIAAVTHLYGMNAGKLMGQRPTNRTIGVYALRFVDLEGGQIARDHHVIDPATVMAQVGRLKIPARKMAEPPNGDPQVVLAKDSKEEQANVDVVKSICAAFGKQDGAAILSALADDVVWSDQTSPSDLEGKAAVEAELKSIFAAFPDLNVNCETTWGAGDYVANLSSWTATNTGAWKEIGIAKPTGKQVSVQDGEIFQLEGGKVKRYWRFSNGMAMAAQLGLAPAKKKK